MKYSSPVDTDFMAGGIKDSKRYTVAAGTFLQDIFKDKIYTDKLLALIREYVTNAKDAHIVAGVRKNIQLHIPLITEESLALHVRDFGKGMSQEEVYDVYASYGKSTKRHTNKQHGVYGLGSKVGFAVSPQFFITSHHNGVRQTYTAYTDAEGLSTIGIIGEAAPTNTNGMEIRVPLSPEHVTALQRAADYFFSFFGGTSFTGYTPTSTVKEYIKGLKHYPDSNDAIMVCEGVPYRIPYEMCRNYKWMGRGSIHACKIGEIETGPARERLVNTKEMQALCAVKDKETEQHIEGYLKTCTWYEALKLATELGRGLTWRGMEVRGSDIRYLPRNSAPQWHPRNITKQGVKRFISFNRPSNVLTLQAKFTAEELGFTTYTYTPKADTNIAKFHYTRGGNKRTIQLHKLPTNVIIVTGTRHSNLRATPSNVYFHVSGPLPLWANILTLEDYHNFVENRRQLILRPYREEWGYLLNLAAYRIPTKLKTWVVKLKQDLEEISNKLEKDEYIMNSRMPNIEDEVLPSNIPIVEVLALFTLHGTRAQCKVYQAALQVLAVKTTI